MDNKSLVASAAKNPLAKRLIGFLMSLVAWANRLYEKSPTMGTLAFVSLTPIVAIIGVVLVVIIVVLVLAALAPTFFQAVADITGALLSADLNSTLANTIAGIVAILVPLVLLFAFVALIFRATKMGNKGR